MTAHARICAASLIGLGSAIPGLATGAASQDAAPIGARRQLFVDEHLIDKLLGTAALKLHRPTPREVVLVTGEPWEGNTCAYYTMFRDGDKFRMYYRGSHYDEKTKRAGHREVTCYAESVDGIKWTRPELGLIEFGGSKRNNIVWDGIGTHCFAVFKDTNPKCTPAARYKAIARGRPRGAKGLYVFQSPDGIRWSLLKKAPVITTGAFDSQNLAFFDTHAGVYREYHRSFHKRVRSIMTGTSKDFVIWSKPKLLEYDDTRTEHLYTNAVLPYPRAPGLFVAFPTRYLPAQGQRVEPIFMASRDGVRFRRWPTAVIPEDAPADRGGNRSNYMAWGLLQLPGTEDELAVYATEAYYRGADSRVRRFTYRVDGFVSLHAGPAGGALLTKPVVFDGRRLTVNFKTAAKGRVRVGIHHADGKPVRGFDAADCTPLRGDTIDATVAWKNGGDVSALAGRAVRLRFELQAADVYAFGFGR